MNEFNSRIDAQREILSLVNSYFFLANKSQEQVTDEYRLLSLEVFELTQRIGRIVGDAQDGGT